MIFNLITTFILVMGLRALAMLIRDRRPYRALFLAFWVLLACSVVTELRDLVLPPAVFCLLLAVARRRREARRVPETFGRIMDEIDLPDYDAVNRRDLTNPPESAR